MLSSFRKASELLLSGLGPKVHGAVMTLTSLVILTIFDLLDPRVDTACAVTRSSVRSVSLHSRTSNHVLQLAVTRLQYSDSAFVLLL